MSWPQLNGFGNVNSHWDEEVPTPAKQKKRIPLEEQAQYSNLTRYSNEKCLYCRRPFFNKLQLYMHNTRHLYIPVEKQELSDSVIQFLKSQRLVQDEIPEELQASLVEKPITPKTSHVEKPITKQTSLVEKPITKQTSHVEKPTQIKTAIRNVGFKKMLSTAYRKLQAKKDRTQTLDLDREILNHKDNLLRDLMTDCKVNLGENIPFRFDKGTNVGKSTQVEKRTNIEKSTKVEKCTNIGKGTNNEKCTKVEKSTNIEKDKNKPDNSILSKFTTNCIVTMSDFFSDIQTDVKKILQDSKIDSEKLKVKSLDEPINNILFNENITVKRIGKKNNEELNKRISYAKLTKTDINKNGEACKLKDAGSNNMQLVGKKVDNFSECEVDNKCNDFSVPHHDLVKIVKSLVCCRICSKHFLNRYQAILHESCHLLLQIPRIDKRPHQCICQKQFKTLYLYSKHTKNCAKWRPSVSQNLNNNAGSKVKLKKEKKTSKKKEEVKLYKGHQNMDLDHRNIDLDHRNIDRDHRNIDRDHRNMDSDYRNIDLDHQNIDLDHQNIDLDHQNIDLDHQNMVLDRTTEPQKTFCHYCNSDSIECSAKCSVIRSDVMKSGDSTYFCKECFSKMEANLTKVGMYDGEMLDRRCVVCNCVGCQFVLAFMTAECVLGI